MRILIDNILAGHESLSWHPLIQDFIIVGRKLEKLGFVYNKDNVIVIDLEEKPLYLIGYNAI